MKRHQCQHKHSLRAACEFHLATAISGEGPRVQHSMLQLSLSVLCRQTAYGTCLLLFQKSNSCIGRLEADYHTDLPGLCCELKYPATVQACAGRHMIQCLACRGAEGGTAAPFQNKAALKVLQGHRSPVRGLAMLPEAGHVASISGDGKLLLWDYSQGTVLRRFSHAEEFSCVNYRWA